MRIVFNRRVEPKPDATGTPATQAQAIAEAGGAAPAAAGPESESVIGNDFTIEGEAITIRCKGSLRINGHIQADLHSARLTVGREAIINGAIAAEQIDVHGRVHGAIHGSHVVLHDSAEVEGDIVSEFLSIQQGASFDGRSRKVKDPAEIRPQLESTGALAARQPAAAPAAAASAAPMHAVPLPSTQPKVLHS